MSTHAHTASKPAESSSFTPVRSSLLQRQCACESQAHASGECVECRGKREPTSNRMATTETQPAQSRPGHDFSRVQIHSDVQPVHASPAQSISINGVPKISSREDHGEVFINGPDPKQSPKPASPKPAPKEETPPAKAAAKCPTDIKVAAAVTVPDNDFGKNGWLTGWGGFALMEVSDPSGQSWDGTEIQENVKGISNTCGARANKVCSNKSGQGFSGSTFKVGEASNFLGLAPLPAKANKFYDIHGFSTKAASILHEQKKPTCEVQCQQSYECGGKQIGPEFTITYSMKQDVIAKIYDVTRVELKKAAAAKSAAAPAAPAGGTKP